MRWTSRVLCFSHTPNAEPPADVTSPPDAGNIHRPPANEALFRPVRLTTCHPAPLWFFAEACDPSDASPGPLTSPRATSPFRVDPRPDRAHRHFDTAQLGESTPIHMAPASPLARRTPTGRRRGRPPGTTNAARAARHASLSVTIASEPPPKKRRYVPGGPGGGGRFIDPGDMAHTPQAAGTGGTVSRTRSLVRDAVNGASPSRLPRRERSTRIRGAASEELEEMRWGSAAAMAASVKQAEDYKPREERSWEEFHPNLDIEGAFLVLRADEVDGLPQEAPATPKAHTPGTPLNGSLTPSRNMNPASTGNTPNPQARSETNPFDMVNGTPSRRSRRSTQNVVNFYSTRPVDSGTPRTPRILPIHNQTPKERLDLKLPSYRKTNRIELFESKTFGQARYVDKAMSNVGYQESDHFPQPEGILIKAVDGTFEDDADTSSAAKPDDHAHNPGRVGRVEYDMDEQDDMWLEQYNAQRKQNELEAITREVFEITMTKIEKEWHALERRIPKPNPKPPQTHRPRSSSAAAVNGEPGAGDEPDSKCAVCDDGDCENTNAIVFCDGCNLAVHQECYGVPFIPEGQWLCRKCQLCGRGVPVSSPNPDRATLLTQAPRHVYSAPIPTAHSNKQTHQSGRICFVPCGFPRCPWGTTLLWSQ